MSRSRRTMSMIQFIDFELMLLRDYIDYVEDYFSQKEKEIHNKFEELESIPADDPVREQLEDYHQSYFDVLQDNLIDENFYNEEFTQRFRYSLVIQIHSFYEKYLSRIERHFKAKNNIKKPIGNYVEKIKCVILQTDISTCTNYDFMVRFTELRNCIVHAEGIIYSDTENTKRLDSLIELRKNAFIDLKETKGQKRTRYEVVIDDKSFLINSVKNIETFLHELDTVLQSHY
jgi:hypothetical protein